MPDLLKTPVILLVTSDSANPLPLPMARGSMESLGSVPPLECGAMGIVDIGFFIKASRGAPQRKSGPGPPEQLLISCMDYSRCLR